MLGINLQRIKFTYKIFISNKLGGIRKYKYFLLRLTFRNINLINVSLLNDVYMNVSVDLVFLMC